MMSVALVTLGVFSYKSLGVDLMPRTEQPNVNVRVGLPGASAEEVETTLTLPIETAVNSIEGIDELRRGLVAYAATGARLWRAQSLGLLAGAFTQSGQVDDAAVGEELAQVAAHLARGRRARGAEIHEQNGGRAPGRHGGGPRVHQAGLRCRPPSQNESTK